MAQDPLILEIRGNSLDDGPGIRTVVFFKGCPLRCVWCHNPESKEPKAELSFDQEPCIGCGRCEEACPHGAARVALPLRVERRACAVCFECVEACPSAALRRLGRKRDVQEIVDAIRPDIPFFSSSGGGVTFSGGEPAMFPRFAGELAASLRALGVHVLLETCGHLDPSAFDRHLYPHLDLIYFDIKLIDDALHREYCGRSNATILETFRVLHRRSLEGGVEVMPRVPLVPGLTATESNLSAVSSFLKDAGAGRVALLPYNPLWPSKLAALGGEDACHLQLASRDAGQWMSREELETCRGFFDGLLVS